MSTPDGLGLVLLPIGLALAYVARLWQVFRLPVRPPDPPTPRRRPAEVLPKELVRVVRKMERRARDRSP